jgi:anti-sigma factor ChrR (cupin superfamily)
MAARTMTTQSKAIHPDMAVRVVMDTTAMDWSPSPSGSVWRKRLHLVGGLESGQVTSIVRYDRDAKFPGHEHPDGEEILVLDGVFSDEAGDWGEDAYLLNPEGFRHAPFSKPGCVIFVKLRQYSGKRSHVALQTGQMPWLPGPNAGVEIKTLYADPGFPEAMRLERWRKASGPIRRHYPGGAEILVLDGAIEDEQGRYGKLTWLRLPPGATHRMASSQGARLYIKTGHLAQLRQSATE